MRSTQNIATPLSAGAPCADCASDGSEHHVASFARRMLVLFGFVFTTVLAAVVIGEWVGLFETFTDRIPMPAGLAGVLVIGFPVFRNVARAAAQRRVTSHTLMTLGVLAAIAVQEWATAALVVVFMRTGDYAERFTTERARGAVRSLAALSPRLARVIRDGVESEVPVEQVRVGEVVVVRPGEEIPVDGAVLAGEATIDQSAITGESMPVEAAAGTMVFAASFLRLGHLRVRATRVGPESTFGRVVKLVADAESRPAQVQRLADRFSAYYLPIVATIAAVTYIVSRDALATAAVLVVACSCAFALATPIAMLAAIGAAARRGVLVKGGLHVEALARADVVLVDKTGTLTLGRPRITRIVGLDGRSKADLLALAAAVERYSEHPYAEAFRTAAHDRRLAVPEPQDFRAEPGVGACARVDGAELFVGRPQVATLTHPEIRALASDGASLLQLSIDGVTAGIFAATDTPRPDVPAALEEVRTLGIRRIELLTGDREPVAARLATELGIGYQAELLPDDKLKIVRRYQEQGHVVVMIGDGINDAPALAAANVGVAMSAAGSPIAIQAAHVALMRDDWTAVPELLRAARRTMRIVRLNIAFTAAYNLAGLALAAVGLLPPVLAAAAQSLPDLLILGNSSLLLRNTAAAPQTRLRQPMATRADTSTCDHC